MRSSRVGAPASAGGCGRRSAGAGGRGVDVAAAAGSGCWRGRGGVTGCWLCLQGVAEKLRARRRGGRGAAAGRRAAVRRARCMAERASMACRVPECEGGRK